MYKLQRIRNVCDGFHIQWYTEHCIIGNTAKIELNHQQKNQRKWRKSNGFDLSVKRVQQFVSPSAWESRDTLTIATHNWFLLSFDWLQILRQWISYDHKYYERERKNEHGKWTQLKWTQMFRMTRCVRLSFSTYSINFAIKWGVKCVNLFRIAMWRNEMNPVIRTTNKCTAGQIWLPLKWMCQ